MPTLPNNFQSSIYASFKSALANLTAIDSSLVVTDTFLNDGKTFAQVEFIKESEDYFGDESNNVIYEGGGSIDYIIYIGIDIDRKQTPDLRSKAFELKERAKYEINNIDFTAPISYQVGTQVKTVRITRVSIEDTLYPVQTDQLSGIMQLNGTINYS